MTKRVRLTPCDYFTLMWHRAQVRSGRGSNIPYMALEIDGELPRETVAAALQRVFAEHPVLTATLRIARLTGHPYWRFANNSADAARELAAAALHYDDLSAADDSQNELHRLVEQRYAAPWDVFRPPQVRLEHYALPGGRTHLVMRWPHFVMDAEGALWFLSELARHAAPPDAQPPPPSELAGDERIVNVLAGRSLLSRLRLFRTATGLLKQSSAGRARPLTERDGTCTSFGLLHRCWKSDEMARVFERAARLAPPGAARNARFIAAAVVRALRDVYLARSVKTDAIVVNLPLRVHLPRRTARPMTGNYLVAPLLSVPAAAADSWQALGDELGDQLDRYRGAAGDLAHWMLMQAASHLRASMFPLVFKVAAGYEALCSGFSYYGEIARPIRSFAGCVVANVYGGGPVSAPPGLNPVFSRFADRLNLSLTWSRPAIADDLARRLAERIEHHLLHAD